MIFRKPRNVQGALNCLQVGHVLQQHLDGLTDPAKADLVEAHLKDSRRCGMKATEFRQLKRALARAGADDGAAIARLREFAAGISRDDQGDDPSA